LNAHLYVGLRPKLDFDFTLLSIQALNVVTLPHRE
jgi:hypothetical protein